MSESPKSFRFSARAARTTSQPIGYLMTEALGRPSLISLAAGFVDYDTLPVSESRKLFSELLGSEDAGRVALQYGTTGGLDELRAALLDHLMELDGVTADELSVSIDNVVVTTGSQQFLMLLTDVLVDPGDIVITAWPSYFVYTGTLQTAGAEVRCVDMDEDGILPESLDALLAELKAAGDLPRVKIVYLVTYHQNPTGITLSAERKPAVLEIVKRYSTDHRILILEDAAYRELTFEGDPPLSIKRLDTANEYVALAQTFSKPFAPGLKTGYALLPSDLIEPMLLQKCGHDFGSANLCQHLLLAALQTGVYRGHLEQLRRQYRRKRDVMLESLAEHLGDFAPGETHWTRPSGGLYVYLTLPAWMDTGLDGDLFAKALEENVLYVPGEFCYGPDSAREVPRSAIRLTFGVSGESEIREGIAALGRAVRGSG